MVNVTFNKSILRGESRADWARRFYTAAKNSGRVFRTPDENLLIIPEHGAPKRVISPDHFDAVLSEIVDIVELRRNHREGEEQAITTALSRPELTKLFFSEQKVLLPEVKSIVHEPVVVPHGRSYIVVKPGFNETTGIYYYVQEGEAPIVPVEGVDGLKYCFSAVPFESPGHFSNLIAWLLGGVCLDPQLDPPLLVVAGNQQGIGKSSVVQAAGSIITGISPNPISPHGSEFGKQVSASFLENNRFLFIDNIVIRGGGSYDNSQLSVLLTQGFSKKMRILGHSRHVSASGILIAASLNDAKLSTDLSTRSLSVKLFTWENRLHIPYCKHYAFENRRRLYGELLWLALQGQDDDVASDAYLGFRFRRWLRFVRPRVEKFFSPLLVEETGTLDEIAQELYHFGLDWHDVDFTVVEFLQRLQGYQSHFPSLATKRGNIASDRGAQTAFGRLLSAKVDKALTLDGKSFVTLKQVATNPQSIYKFTVEDRTA